MFKVYIIQSIIHRRYYVGCTNNLERRLAEHNSGQCKSTARFAPWKLVCYTLAEDQQEAFDLEKQVKSYKGGNAFKKIINGEVPKWLKGRVC